MISRFYYFSKSVIRIAGIVISIASLIPLSNSIRTLIFNKFQDGNEPFLISVVISFMICVVILAWGSKTLFFPLKNIKENNISVPSEFKDFNELGRQFEQKRLLSPYHTDMTIKKKDFFFIILSSSFLALILIAFIVKANLSTEFFWNLKFTPENFTFPFFFTGILIMILIIRSSSLLIYMHRNEFSIGVFEIIRTIKSEIEIETIIKEISKSLALLKQSENPTNVYFLIPSDTRYTEKNNGQVHSKLFIETQPTPATIIPQFVIYFYLSFSIILYFIGFIFLVQLPPDNISVLSVPSIALGYIWALIKGGILVICAAGFLSAVAPICIGYLSQSVMAYIKLDGSFEGIPQESENVDCNGNLHGNLIIRGKYEFNIYITEMVTEFIPSKGRQIIKVFNNKNAIEAKRLLINAIDASALTEEIKKKNLLVLKEKI